ncbi:MAG: TIGR04084 family radical SAM/SPASM domain-containing protein [Candidatus Diapherotrites archaeon]|nr:TIGR04084 family radical SAM/SPASM domain-containing protein [Candidatus Diapherotrites archaeon]
MFFHVLLSNNCNMLCRYCGEKAFSCSSGMEKFALDEKLPADLDYDLKLLCRFVEKDPDCTLTFYGGEPTLRLDLIRKIMDECKAKRFMMQTNGLLLDKLEPEYMNRFHTILVSLDGNRALTDYNRGKGTYNRVIANLKKIKGEGFKGELIARMTVTEKTNIFSAVKHLVSNKDFPFESVHWQMDANFWNDFRQRKKFRVWLEKNYLPNTKKLLKFWISKMKKEGRVLRLYPFLDTTEDLLLGKKSLLRCGSGYANYSIMTNGFISPCPIMAGMKDFYVGHISTAHPLKLKKIFVSNPCPSCSIYSFCGGRCLYSNIVKPWPKEGRDLACKSVKEYRKMLLEALPEIKGLIKQGKISLADFEHIKFNGCEIIP